MAGAVATALALILMISPALQSMARAAAGQNYLTAGQQLGRTESIVSPDGRFRLTFQEDQNVVILGPDRGNGVVRHQFETRNSGAVRLSLQSDGNLVLYTASNAVAWQSDTDGTGPGNKLVMQDDGNVVLYGPSNAVLWQSYTREDWTALRPGMQLKPGEALTNGPYRLLLQADDRNLVVYGPSNVANWNAGIRGKGATALRMQTDGNLVAYNGSTPVWQTGTHGHANASLVMQADGNLVIYENGLPIWDSLGFVAGGQPAGFIRPAQGPISRNGEYLDPDRDDHRGIDIDGQCRDHVSASNAGRVSRAAWNDSYGWYVTIDHGTVNGKSVSTRYAHLDQRSSLTEGAQITRGAFVGYEGTTGNSTGCHLHFEVIENGVRVNPRLYVTF